MTALPEALYQVQASLEPYIKKRQDVSEIRKVLSSHLSSSLSSTAGAAIARPLSLLEGIDAVEHSTNGSKGLQKEFLRCVRANLKARNEYTTVSNEHRSTYKDIHDVPQQSRTYAMDISIQLTRLQQKHERLCIIQDYIEAISQKPAAATEHLDPKLALIDVESLPSVPPEVINSTSTLSKGQGLNLKELVDQLEKSVFRAKLLLSKEQKLLAKLRSDNNPCSANRGDRLKALGLTRNELINWIEAEMEKAGSSSAEAEGEEQSTRDVRGKAYIEGQLVSIQRQYLRYIDARQALVTSSSAIAGSSLPASHEMSEVQASGEELQQLQSMQVVYPYLDKLVCIANQQKATIQQRSHLTISLAKQVKEATQGLDRLAEESHLLPAHPVPTASSQRKGSEGALSFNDELLQHEKPDSSNRASAWFFAAESVTHTMKDAIAQQLEAGGNALEDSQNSLSKLHHLLGYDTPISGTVDLRKRDIWTGLDGSLGVIKNEDMK